MEEDFGKKGSNGNLGIRRKKREKSCQKNPILAECPDLKRN